MQDEHFVQCNLVAALHLHALRDFGLYQSFQSPSCSGEILGASTIVNNIALVCMISRRLTGFLHKHGRISKGTQKRSSSTNLREINPRVLLSCVYSSFQTLAHWWPTAVFHLFDKSLVKLCTDSKRNILPVERSSKCDLPTSTSLKVANQSGESSITKLFESTSESLPIL
jgi:hypothetical protein